MFLVPELNLLTLWLVNEGKTTALPGELNSLHSISLLQDEIGLYKDMYSFYMGLKGLSLIGLESYSRRIAVEENFDFLSK